MTVNPLDIIILDKYDHCICNEDYSPKDRRVSAKYFKCKECFNKTCKCNGCVEVGVNKYVCEECKLNQLHQKYYSKG